MQHELPDQILNGLTEVKDNITKTQQSVADVNTELKSLKEENERLQSEFSKLQRLYLSRQSSIRTPRFGQLGGLVTDECAAHLGAVFIQQCAKSGKLELVSQSTTIRDALFKDSREILGLETDRKSTRLNSSHSKQSRMPSSA